jgi:hypothetical protein
MPFKIMKMIQHTKRNHAKKMESPTYVSVKSKTICHIKTSLLPYQRLLGGIFLKPQTP